MEPERAHDIWRRHIVDLGLLQPTQLERSEHLVQPSDTILLQLFVIRDDLWRHCVIAFNMHTRCEISRHFVDTALKSGDDLSIASMAMVNRHRVALIVEKRIGILDSTHYVTCYIIEFCDDFKKSEIFEMDVQELRRSSNEYHAVQSELSFAVPVQGGFVYAVGIREALSLYLVKFADLLSSADTGARNGQNIKKKVVPPEYLAAVNRDGHRRMRNTIIPVDENSFAMTHRFGELRVFDVRSKTFMPPVEVDWFFNTFPPPVIHSLNRVGDRLLALVQSIKGEKFLLNLKTGGVESIPPFISPDDSRISPSDNGRFSRAELTSVGYVPRKRGGDGWELGVTLANYSHTFPVADVLYLDTGHVFNNGVIYSNWGRGVAWQDECVSEIDCCWQKCDVVQAADASVATRTRNRVREAEESGPGPSKRAKMDDDSVRSTTLARIYFGKVPSLSDLSVDALLTRMKPSVRYRLTMEKNPQTVAALVQAILRLRM